jgi:hypothetical protein
MPAPFPAIALQAKAGKALPLAIMTSDDTHQRTLELLEGHAYFGATPEQVTLIKQEKVACLEGRWVGGEGARSCIIRQLCSVVGGWAKLCVMRRLGPWLASAGGSSLAAVGLGLTGLGLAPNAVCLLLAPAACRLPPVPCPRPPADNDAHLALLSGDPFQVQTKPHGHGDVHMLLHSTGEAGRGEMMAEPTLFCWRLAPVA